MAWVGSEVMEFPSRYVYLHCRLTGRLIQSLLLLEYRTSSEKISVSRFMCPRENQSQRENSTSRVLNIQFHLPGVKWGSFGMM